MNAPASLDLTPHILRNETLSGWEEHIAGRWHYRDLAADPKWRRGWISFDALALNPVDGSIYCGLNSIDGDLLYRFEPQSQTFQSLSTRRWTDPFDAKIHRTLLWNPADECFYFATSLLHDIDKQHLAPGGKIVRYDWRKDIYDILSIPFPSLYLQSIAMDAGRGIIYAFSYPAELLIRFDIGSKRSRVLGYIGNATHFSQPHNAVVDRHGWLWGTCAETRAWDERTGPCPIRLFKYHPDRDQFVWFDHGLSRKADTEQLVPPPSPSTDSQPDLTETRHKEDWGFCDSMAYDGGKYIYAGTVAGVLCRIDIETNQVEKIANVMQAGRVPALGFDRHGRIHAAGGMKHQTGICRFDPQTLDLDLWENLRHPSTGDSPARIHELCFGLDDTLYLAENDNHTRSSYLWSVKLPETHF